MWEVVWRGGKGKQGSMRGHRSSRGKVGCIEEYIINIHRKGGYLTSGK